MSDGNEGIANGDCILGIVEQTATFSFGGRGYNTAKGTAFRVDRSVGAWAWLGRWGRGEITEEVVACNAAFGFG